MRSAAAQILETALALQRAPGERFRLRERPLPTGLVHLIEIASGSSQALSVVARETGEDERTLLEAARFYLEQVLFAAPDATAYRILGVSPDADPELIRTHHRWLQRWLHPDRAQAGDASVYATRVNQAWATLRTPESRHQYDVRLAEARMAGATAPLPASTVRHWEHEDAGAVAGGRARWLLGAALMACAVLAVLIFRHEQTPAPWSPEGGTLAQATSAVADGPALDDRDFGILAEALAAASPVVPEPLPESVPVPAAAMVNPTPAPAAIASTLESPPAPRPRSVPVVNAVVPLPVPAPATPAEPRPGQMGAAGDATVSAPILTPAPVAPPAAPEPGLPETLLQRMALAERRYAELAAYIAADAAVAPAWSDARSQSAADRVRQRMAVRGAVQFDPPNWSLQLDRARLSVDYRCDHCGVRRGRLDIQMVWREGAWQVRGVELGPAA